MDFPVTHTVPFGVLVAIYVAVVLVTIAGVVTAVVYGRKSGD